jgi:hypothetical protein
MPDAFQDAQGHDRANVGPHIRFGSEADLVANSAQRPLCAKSGPYCLSTVGSL